MTDKLITILKIGVVVLLVVAIGMGGWLVYTKFIKGNDDGGEVEDGPVNLVWWTLWEDQENLQVLVDAYEEENPDVNIQIVEQKLEGRYQDKLLEQLGTESGPDIMRIHNTWLPMFQSKLSALPNEVMSESEYSQSFYDTALLDFKGGDGRLYGIPLMFDGIGVYYNKDLLSEAGYTTPAETWDDFLTQAQDLTKRDETGTLTVSGAGLGLDDEKVNFSFEIVSLLMLQSGNEMVDSSGKTTFGDDLAAAEAVKYYTDYATRYNIFDRTLDSDIQMFAEGRMAMMFAPSWRVHDINEALQSANASLNYDVAPVPQQPSEAGDIVYFSDYWAESVSASCENPEVAWDFLKFISQKEQLRTFYEKCKETRAFGEIYPRPDMADEIIGDKYVGAYVKMAENARSWKMVNRQEVSDAFNTMIRNIVVQGVTSESNISGRLEELSIVVDQIIAQSS